MERHRPALAMSIMSALGGSARMPALLDITCGSALVKTTTSPASSGIGSPPTRLAKQRPCGHHVIGDQVIGARQDARQDHLPRRRPHRPRRLRRNFEIGRAGQPHGLQKVREGVGCHSALPGSPRLVAPIGGQFDDCTTRLQSGRRSSNPYAQSACQSRSDRRKALRTPYHAMRTHVIPSGARTGTALQTSKSAAQ